METVSFSVGAVGAAIIAGLVSLLGLLIGKEQKVSEFRQKWIDDLRDCMSEYLAHINAISDVVRLRKAGGTVENSQVSENYKKLNLASHGITLRVNEREKPSQALLASMETFEAIAKSNSLLNPENLKQAEVDFLAAAKTLLKFEWKRVKNGEPIYRWTKWLLIACLSLMAWIFAQLWQSPDTVAKSQNPEIGEVVKEDPAQNRALQKIKFLCQRQSAAFPHGVQLR